MPFFYDDNDFWTVAAHWLCQKHPANLTIPIVTSTCRREEKNDEKKNKQTRADIDQLIYCKLKRNKSNLLKEKKNETEKIGQLT